MMGVLPQLALISLASLACTLADCQDALSCPSQDLDESDSQRDVLSLVQMSFADSRSKRASSKVLSFASFVAEYGRTYTIGSEEYEMRRGIFEHRLKSVYHQNCDTERRWSAGVNDQIDRSDDELAQLRGLRPMQADSNGASQAGVHLGQIDNTIIPEEKSWTNLHATRADTNQLHCGSCWAVASATVLTANAEIKGHSRRFSPQELVDCVPNPNHCGGQGGCRGSVTELAMNWVMEHGLATLTETPYEAKDTTCKKRVASLLSHDGDHDGANRIKELLAVGFHAPKSHSSAGLALGLRGWEKLPENDYEPLLRAVAQTGPVAVSVAAHAWHSYNDGIFDGCKRDAVIDHAVTLVGYGKDKRRGDKYWIIKNSWGLHWGENGNIRLLRHEGNTHCGIDHHPKVGTGCDGGPSEVKVCGMCGILFDSVVPHFEKF